MRNCNCSNTIRQDKEEIIKRAIKYAVEMEVDVQVHSWTQRGIGRLWDFEEKGSVERGKGVVKIIKFRDHKSKNVLPDSKSVGGDNGTKQKSSKPTGGKSGKGNKKPKPASD